MEDYYHCKVGHQWFCKWPQEMPAKERIDMCPICMEGHDCDVYHPTELEPDIHKAMLESMTVEKWH